MCGWDWDEVQLIADGFERMYVELEWYDGPRVGLAAIDGRPHYFDGYGQYFGDGADEYRGWPASAAAVEWEREQMGALRQLERAPWGGGGSAGPPGPERNRRPL